MKKKSVYNDFNFGYNQDIKNLLIEVGETIHGFYCAIKD
jgi:hypothetical protein